MITPSLSDAVGHCGARVVVDKPMEAMLPLLSRFHRDEPRGRGVHPSAVVSASARISEDVTIDACAVVHDAAVVGPGSWIGANAVIGAGCTLGRDVRMHAGAILYPFVEIGDRVVLHAGSSVGREGFGFVPQANGITRIPHVGRCVIEHDVEIGANSCVDRGSIDDTIIGAGTKIDNLCHVAHNVRIGRLCFMASQVGISGSARIGDGVQIGGQAGLGGHITVGSRASLGGQAGVFGDVPEGEMWSGYPARPHKEALRAQAALFKLAKLIRPLEKLLSRGESA
jgi:UDP-3-O-[3-hydroxymyristoyl] glucosamine N-acyltransferase